MGKGLLTREMILNKAAEQFSVKGYAGVTMKDICETADLSRGGLYRHFSSPKEIFQAILNRDLQTNTLLVDEALGSGTPAQEIIQHYFNQEKAAVLSPNRGFYFAVHEFAFLEKDQREYFEKRTHDSYELLSGILTYGQNRGEFKKIDIEAVTMHILYFWDSLKTTSSVLKITEEDMDRQIALIKGLLL